MDARLKPPALRSICRQLCPRCRIGPIFRSSIFRGFPAMHERCAACGLKFEREEGFFLGAMYISYGLALVLITLFTAILWMLTGWPLERSVLGAIVLFVPLTPTLSRLSRVLWIYADQAFDPR